MKHRCTLVGMLLCCSGMCALIFQVAWLREFRLVFGGSTAASGAVLAIFMAGLGLGNAVLGRRVDRQTNPLAYYGTLELWIGLSAAASPFLIDLIRTIYISLGGRTVLGMTGATCLRLALSTIVLGLPTFLMGGTLPAASKAVTTLADSNRLNLALLYGLNTLGAVCGALLSTFLLLEALGTRQTLWLACSVNICLALGARRLSRRLPMGEEKAPAQAERQSARSRALQKGTGKPRREETTLPGFQSAALNPRLIYAAAGMVGFAFFLMELVWYRMLGPLLGGTTFTFGLILAVALLGIGLGGAAYSLIFRYAEPTATCFALTCGLEAACVALPFALGDWVAILAVTLRDHAAANFQSTVLGWAVVATLVILPAAFVSGVQFPLLIALLGKGDRDVGKQVGLAFAANTAGAILGSLGGGFGILPYLTAPGTWLAVVVLLCLLGLAVLAPVIRTAGMSLRLAVPLATFAAALLMLTATGPTAVWRHSTMNAGQTKGNSFRERTNFFRRRVVWESEGRESSIAIIAADGLAFISNGKSDGNSIVDAGTQIMGGLIGSILHPDPKTCFVVGLGTGETAGWLAEVSSMTSVSVVELEPEVDEMARRCASINYNVLEHPKVRRIYDDAREVLLTSPEHYDLIVSEPSNPYRAGVANLYTREFYLAARDRLNDRGIFSQWLQMYAVDEQTLQTVVTTLRSVFPCVEVWETEMKDSLFVCSMEPLDYSVPELRERISHAPFPAALAQAWQTTDLEGVLAHYVAGSAVVADWNQAGPKRPNTDNRNQVEYGFARTVGLSGEFSLTRLREAAIRLGARQPPLVGGEIDSERVGDQYLAANLLAGNKAAENWKFSRAQQTRGQALLWCVTGESRRAIQAWRKQPREPEYPLEVALLALAYADQGDARMHPLLERLAAFQPVEAVAIHALYHWRRQEPQAASDDLERVFRGLHDDPWPHSAVMEHIFGLALDVARNSPQQAPRLFEALRQPFALYRLEEERRRVAVALALSISPAAAARPLEELEPHIPWTRAFLEQRSRIYTLTQHPRMARATRDLDSYLRQER